MVIKSQKLLFDTSIVVLTDNLSNQSNKLLCQSSLYKYFEPEKCQSEQMQKGWVVRN